VEIVERGPEVYGPTHVERTIFPTVPMTSIVNDQQGVDAVMLYQKRIEVLGDSTLSDVLLLNFGFADGKVIDTLKDMK
jgi:hypothetical protein